MVGRQSKAPGLELIESELVIRRATKNANPGTFIPNHLALLFGRLGSLGTIRFRGAEVLANPLDGDALHN